MSTTMMILYSQNKKCYAQAEGTKMMSTTPLSLSFPSTCRTPRRGGRLEKDLEQDRDYNKTRQLCVDTKTKASNKGNVSIKNTKVKSRQGAEQDHRQLRQHCFFVWEHGKGVVERKDTQRVRFMSIVCKICSNLKEGACIIKRSVGGSSAWLFKHAELLRPPKRGEGTGLAGLSLSQGAAAAAGEQNNKKIGKQTTNTQNGSSFFRRFADIFWTRLADKSRGNLCKSRSQVTLVMKAHFWSKIVTGTIGIDGQLQRQGWYENQSEGFRNGSLVRKVGVQQTHAHTALHPFTSHHSCHHHCCHRCCQWGHRCPDCPQQQCHHRCHCRSCHQKAVWGVD